MSKSPRPVSTFLRSNRSRAQGMSSIMLLLAVAMGAIALISALKLMPLYVENWGVKNVLDGIAEEYATDKTFVGKKQIRSRLARRFNINQVKGLSYKDVKIERIDENYVVTADYETRVELVGNIDVVLKFENNVIELPYR